MNRNQYHAYVENGIVGADPLQLVVAMYRTAIQRAQEARSCLAAGDAWGRARAISKASAILSELIVSLNPEAGPEIGRNLDSLYHYMQNRLQEAHLKRVAEPLIEVETLLKNLLEAWEKVADLPRKYIKPQETELPPGITEFRVNCSAYFSESEEAERVAAFG